MLADLVVLDVEHDVAEAVEGDRVGDELPVLRARLGHLGTTELVGLDRLAGLGERRAAREVRGDGANMSRPWYVAAVGSRRCLDVLISIASTTPPSASPPAAAGRCPADQDAVLLGGAQRDGPPLGTDLGIDDRDVDARREVRQRAPQHERARADVVARDAVCYVDDPRSGAARAITPWHTPTKSSSWP